MDPPIRTSSINVSLVTIICSETLPRTFFVENFQRNRFISYHILPNYLSHGCSQARAEGRSCPLLAGIFSSKRGNFLEKIGIFKQKMGFYPPLSFENWLIFFDFFYFALTTPLTLVFQKVTLYLYLLIKQKSMQLVQHRWFSHS